MSCASAAFFFAGYLLASCCIGFCAELLLLAKDAAVWLGRYALWVLTPAKRTVAAAKLVGWFLLWLVLAAAFAFFFGANIVKLVQILSLVVVGDDDEEVRV